MVLNSSNINSFISEIRNKLQSYLHLIVSKRPHDFIVIKEKIIVTPQIHNIEVNKRLSVHSEINKITKKQMEIQELNN